MRPKAVGRESIGSPGAEARETDLICFSHLRWDFVYQRPQHLLSRAARTRRVVYVEEAIHDAARPFLETRRDESGVRIVVPHLPHDGGAPGTRAMLDSFLSEERHP